MSFEDCLFEEIADYKIHSPSADAFIKNFKDNIFKVTKHPELTLYHILSSLGYNPFDGYLENIQEKTLQQIIFNNQDAFIPFFQKWGETYNLPLKSSELDKLLFYLGFEMAERLELILNVLYCECPKYKLGVFIDNGIGYITNSYDTTADRGVDDYLLGSSAPYAFVMYEFTILNELYKLSNIPNPSEYIKNSLQELYKIIKV